MCNFHNDDQINVYDYGPETFPRVDGRSAHYIAAAHIRSAAGVKTHLLVTASDFDIMRVARERLMGTGQALRCAMVEKYRAEALTATEARTIEREWTGEA